MTALYKTVPVTRDQEKRALNQEERILKFCQFMGPDAWFRIDEIHTKCFTERTPITSVRRAVTNLTDKGLLEKSGDDALVSGPHGMSVHRWRLAPEPGQLGLFERRAA